jgi:hypothetical protein
MKRFLVLIFALSSLFSFSQEYGEYEINFEDTSQFFRINIDTISNPENVWQIGVPQKTILNTAYSIPNAIITDTVNPYPANDTSIFTILHICDGGYYYGHTVILAGVYMSDSDSLSDYGKIEFTPDMGSTWINLIDDTVYSDYIWWESPKPTLTGLIPEWTYFYVTFPELGIIFNIEFGDTVFYRFTFISGPDSNLRGGLMFDDLYFEDSYQAIGENEYKDLNVNIFPIPAQSYVTIEFDNVQYSPFLLEVFSLNGKRLLSTEGRGDDEIKIDISALEEGLYLFHLTNLQSQQKAFGKIIVTK